MPHDETPPQEETWIMPPRLLELIQRYMSRQPIGDQAVQIIWNGLQACHQPTPKAPEDA
jgi:hypothetical protein